MGDDRYSTSWLRILDIGGMCWEDKDSKSLNEALRKAENWTSLEIEN